MVGRSENLDFWRKAWAPARANQVPKEEAAVKGMTRWGREKLGKAKGEAEGFLLFFFSPKGIA